MSLNTLNKIAGLFTVCFLLFSCEKNLNEIKKTNTVRLTATSQVEKFTLKHTDSTRIKLILKSPLMYDFSDVKFPFIEFPKNVDITLYDNNGQRTFITADYAISYSKTNIYDFRNNVKIKTDSGRILETDQLYYDQVREWVFTEKDCKLTDTDGTYYFKGFDAKSDLTKLEARNFRGAGTFSE